MTVSTEATISRVHQEDVCQSPGIMPTRKYQNEGGFSPVNISADGVLQFELIAFVR
jgi:hypothetical protein